LTPELQRGRTCATLGPVFTPPHVLAVDELGHFTYAADAANVLFHVVNHRHLRKRPMIFTTNKPLSEWGEALHDEGPGGRRLDRILEGGRFIHLDGPRGASPELVSLAGGCSTCQNFRNPQWALDWEISESGENCGQMRSGSFSLRQLSNMPEFRAKRLCLRISRYFLRTSVLGSAEEIWRCQ
jgi:hypothetical protein